MIEFVQFGLAVLRDYSQRCILILSNIYCAQVGGMGWRGECIAFIEFIYFGLYCGDKVCDNKGIFYHKNGVLWPQKHCDTSLWRKVIRERVMHHWNRVCWGPLSPPLSRHSVDQTARRWSKWYGVRFKPWTWFCLGAALLPRTQSGTSDQLGLRCSDQEQWVAGTARVALTSMNLRDCSSRLEGKVSINSEVFDTKSIEGCTEWHCHL